MNTTSTQVSGPAADAGSRRAVDRFDVLWTLTATGHDWSFAQVTELALPGDQTQPISD